MANKFWVASRKVVLPDEENGLCVAPAAIRIEGATITAVVSLDEGEAYAASLARAVGEDSCRNDEHRLISPAFVNAHTHLALVFLRGVAAASHGIEHDLVEDVFFDFERRLSPDDVRAFARMGAYESLLHGVGLVWDHYYFGRALAEGCVDVGLAAVVAPTLQDLAGPGKGREVEAFEATVEIAGSERLAAHGIYAAVGPHATDTVSPSLWLKSFELASAHQLPLHAHCAQSQREWDRIRTHQHKTPMRMLVDLGINYVPSALLVHCIYASREDLIELNPARLTLGFCPFSQTLFAFPAPVDLWDSVDIPWLVATDCAASNDSMNVQKELRFASGWRATGLSWSTEFRRYTEAKSRAALGGLVPRAGLRATASDLLAKVWEIPGRLHPAFDAGVIREGALANLVIWDTDHPSFWPCQDPLWALAMGDTTLAIEQMVVAGRLVGERGNFHRSLTHSDAYRDAMTEARRRLESLRQGR